MVSTNQRTMTEPLIPNTPTTLTVNAFRRTSIGIVFGARPIRPSRMARSPLQLATVLPPEAIGADLSFVSLNTDVVIVRERDGWLQALENHEAGGVQTADIIIQAESGATTTKTVAVDFGQIGYAPPEESLDDFVPEFTVSQKIRITGDTEWHNCVDAKVGDELKIQFEYQNTSENEHVDVAVRDILPANLGYIPGSTTIYTTQTPTGLKKEDGIVGNGIYIGTYGSNSNAYVRFRARKSIFKQKSPKGGGIQQAVKHNVGEGPF